MAFFGRHSTPSVTSGLPPKQGTGTGVTSAPPTLGGSGYLPIVQLNFPGLRPFQLGQPTPIPSNNMGMIGQRPFHKTRGPSVPLTKIVVKSQLVNQ